TVRCRSVVNSLGLSCSSATSPRSAARPTTPVCMTGATSSGSSEITPNRYIGTRSIIRRPVDDDQPRLQVDLFDDVAGDERDQQPRRAVEHEHVVTAGCEQMIDRTEHGAGRRAHLEPFEVRPIELACRNLWKLLAWDDDVGADPVASPIAIVEAVQFCDHAASVAMPFLHIEGVIDAVHTQRPRAESDNVVARLRVGLHFEPPFDAEHAADAAEDDPLLFRAHCGIAGRPKPLRRFGGSAVLLEQVRDPLGWLSALGDPVVDALKIDAQPLLTARRDRIEESDALDVLSTTRTAAIRHDDVIERTLDRAAACQPNDHHSENPPFQKNQGGPIGPPV